MASSHSEIKAGAFVAFSLALLFVMVFAVGDCGRYLQGRQEREVLFSSVTGLQPNSAVNYAGVEIGRVAETRIVEANEEILAKLPRVTADNLSRLPLSYDEIETLREVKLPAAVEEEIAQKGLDAVAAAELRAARRSEIIDREARRLIGAETDSKGRRRPGRKMILLVLEIRRGTEFRLREDDLVRMSTTVMGDSTVEISPGSGVDLPAGRALLGDGSNLFTQVSDSMREIRTLLARVSGIIGEEERVNIKATLANVKKASEELSLTVSRVREVVRENETPVKEAVRDLRQCMAEAREAVALVRKTIEELKPKVLTALESGRVMMESGRKAAETADKLMADARPRLLEVMEEAARTAKGATATLEQVEGLLGGTEDALEENRPAVRRALADLRESARNFKEMSDTLRRQPWLLLRKPSVKDHEVMLVESSARSLAAAAQDLVTTSEYLEKLASDPEACARFQEGRVQDLIGEIRTLHEELQKRGKRMEEDVRKLDRKTGGRAMEKAREEADRAK